MIFVSGGVRSGKSSFAESLLKSDDNKVYIATSIVYDDEMASRVSKHLGDRKHDNWLTLEQPNNLSEVLNKVNSSSNILLDCLTNLVANEIFTNNLSSEQVISKVCNDIELLNNKVNKLVIVSNDVFTEGNNYQKETTNFIHTLGLIHQFITNKAMDCYELVYKVPVKHK